MVVDIVNKFWDVVFNYRELYEMVEGRKIKNVTIHVNDKIFDLVVGEIKFVREFNDKKYRRLNENSIFIRKAGIDYCLISDEKYTFLKLEI